MASTVDRSSKEPVTSAAGPYGHPIHPLLVTVPIGTWVASLIFDILSRTSEEPGVFGEGAYWLIAIGIVGAVLAAVFGVLDLLTTRAGTPARRTGIIHMVLNTSVLGMFVVSWIIRSGGEYENETSTGLIVLSVVALVILTVSGWLGGRMTYRYGVRVADERDQAEGWRETPKTHVG